MDKPPNLNDKEKSGSEKKKVLEYIDKITKEKIEPKTSKKIHIFYFILILTIIGPILLCLFCLNIPFELTYAIVLSVIALVFSTISLIFRFITMLDYPFNDLEIKELNEEIYQLQFLVKNVGHGKLTLKLAIYFIEKRNLTATNDDFFRLENEKTVGDLNDIKKKIKEDDKNIEFYSLETLQQDYNVFFSHDDIHWESNIHHFEKSKLYRITFYILTSNNISYYCSRHILTKDKNIKILLNSNK